MYCGGHCTVIKKNNYLIDYLLSFIYWLQTYINTSIWKYTIVFDLKNQFQKTKKNAIYDDKIENRFILTWPTVSSRASSIAVGDLQS